MNGLEFNEAYGDQRRETWDFTALQVVQYILAASSTDEESGIDEMRWLDVANRVSIYFDRVYLQVFYYPHDVLSSPMQTGYFQTRSGEEAPGLALDHDRINIFTLNLIPAMVEQGEINSFEITKSLYQLGKEYEDSLEPL